MSDTNDYSYIDPGGDNKQAGIKRLRTRTELTNAFTAFQNGKPGSVDFLLDLVRKFVYKKLYYLELEFRHLGTADTVDDWTQDVLIDIWKQLDRDMRPESFYPWVHKIVYNHGADVFDDLLKEKRSKVGVLVSIEDDSGEMEYIDNPLIYADDEGGVPTLSRIPTEVTGIDREICNLMLSEVDDLEKREKGKGSATRTRTYAEIAAIVGISENAVKMRLRGLRNKFGPEWERRKARIRTGGKK